MINRTAPPSVKSPVVNLRVGGYSLSDAFNFIESFTYHQTRKAHGNKVKITLVDTSWKLLDSGFLKKLLKAGAVEFSFGWSGGIEVTETKNLKIFAISPSEVTMEGIRYTIDAQDIISLDGVGTKPRMFVSAYISDIVKSIAIENNWNYKIEPTDALFEYPLDEGYGTEGTPYTKPSGMSDLAFIRYLAARASSSSKIGKYIAYIEEPTAGKTVLHFHPSEAHKKKVMKEYILIHDNMGEVISFAPKINVAMFTFTGLNNLTVIGRNPTNLNHQKVSKKPSTFEGAIA
jgi:hypothetical protein